MFKSLSLLKQLLVVILGLAIMLVTVVMPVVDSNVHDIIKLNGQNVNNLSFIESEKFSDFCYYCSLNGYVALKGFEKIKLGQYLVSENNKTFIYDQYKFERRFKMYKI